MKMTAHDGGGRASGVTAGVLAVIDRMEALDFGPDPRDGVRAFTAMYTETTRQVWLAVSGRGFADRAFMASFDVQFAELYFEALSRHAADPAGAPRCWAALFSARNRPGVTPLQFAVAGMTAHIGYDLPRALVEVTRATGRDLSDPGIRADYLAVNAVLERTQPIVKRTLLAGPWASLDDALGTSDDRAGLWAISTAREAAWSSAQALWQVHGSFAQKPFEVGLDRLVAAAAGVILTPS
jgi:hypothetical protein